MKKIYGFITALLLSGAVPTTAQHVFTSSSLGSYTQDFNTLNGTVNFANNTTLTGVYAMAEVAGGAFTPGSFTGNDGSNTTAYYYHFGTAGSTDRSLGGIAALNTGNGVGHVGIRFRNSSGVTIKNLEIQYAMEQWYNSGRQDAARVDVAYQTGTNLNSLLNSSGTWTSISGLGVDAPSTATVISSRDGNSPSNRRVKQVTLNNVNLADGQEIMLRWSYVLNSTTNGNGLSVDDVVVTPITNIFYSDPASTTLQNLSSWGTNADGSGTRPTTFSTDNTTYYIQGNQGANVRRINGNNNSSWTVSGTNSKIVVGRPNETTPSVFYIQNNDNVSGTIDVGPRATLTVNKGGNFSFALGRLDNTSTVEYVTGSTPVNISERSYGNLKISGAADKMLTNNTVVNGNLVINGANLKLGNYNLSVIRGGSVTGATSSAFVITNGTGTLRQSVPNSGSDIVFPVGAVAGSYTPVSLQQPSSTTARNEDVFAVRVLDGMYASYDANGNGTTAVQNQNVKKTWLVEEEVAGNSDVTMTLQWNTDDEMSGGAAGTSFDRTKAYVSHYISGAIPYFDKGEAAAATAGNVTNSYKVSRSGLTSFSPYAVSSRADAPLPVELLTFGAERAGRAVQVGWRTASEKDNSHFVVERSSNGREFAALGTVAGAGTTASGRTYAFTDAKPLSTLAYYRLRQVDQSGAATYSPVVLVKACADCGPVRPTLAVVPNPGTGVFQVLDAAGTVAPLYGTVFNSLGTAMLHLSGQTTLDLSAQPAGVYILRLSAEQGAAVMRLVKQ